ncbi:MAG: bifunctional 2-polyprenyl-6-hydroxyphenol methylase/3-demethylubiquinol 3-O-methyltransferase UbiG [Proteobacteria bacterium]|nr:bifunctional 2-polyprenyl-6-hydroxyphenol methylase/3-demethylubiquinol 3-O-methyltransferase UbiG [Pseudomonadota bacterium]
MPTASTIDPAEVDRFAALSGRWWDERGPMAQLHALNPVRMRYLRDGMCEQFGRKAGRRPLAGLRVLDIGCGAGLLCEPLARLGAEVTGIDAAPDHAGVAQRHAADAGLRIEYRTAAAEDLAGETWDAVLAMEIIEHVPDARAFVHAAAAAVAPGGMFFGATLNRTMRSLALGIGMAEWVLRWVPRGTHDWRRFVRPSEFAAALRGGGLEVADVTGVTFDPATGGWHASRDVGVNYMLRAAR